MFSKEKFMTRVSEIGSTIQKEANRLAPAILSQDKKFANAFATTISSLVCADLKIETDETLQAINFIQNDPRLKELGLVVYSIDFYSNIITDLSMHFENEPAYLVQKARIIQENIPGLSGEYKSYIRALCNQLAGPTANQKEVLVRNEIIAALG